MKLSGFKGKIAKLKFCVLGDVILDHYVQGIVTRLSPEAPVPVLEVNGGFNRLGGAANVAANLAAMGAITTLVSIVGDDLESVKLKKLLEKAKVNYALVTDPSRKTTRKCRVRSTSQQICRLDYEDKHPVGEKVFNEVAEMLRVELKKADALIISDYGKGCLSQKLLLWLEEEALSRIPTYYSPKPPIPIEMRGPTFVVANRTETAALLGNSKRLAINEAVSKLRDLFSADAAMMTMGADGLVLWIYDQIFVVPAEKQEVYDVSGAGDTVLAMYALGRTLGLSGEVSAKIASRGAGHVLQEMGTCPVKWEQMREMVW